MNKLFSIISLVALIFFSTGCDKYLDLEPSQSISESIALNSDENVKSVLLGAYVLLNYYPTTPTSSAGLYGGLILRDAELLGGDGEIQWVGTYIDPRQIFNKDMISTNSEANVHWRDAYKLINTVNNVLSALDVVNAEDRDRVEGEALFLRALNYFDLVRFFGQQYESVTAGTDYGVPLILTPTRGINDNSYVGRNSVEEVYNQVIADLTRAASILPPDNDVYATSGAAYALLARVYLQKGDYTNARSAANTVIESGDFAILNSYADCFNQDNNTAEDIFATQITPQDISSSMNEFFSVPIYGGRDGDIDILQAHLDLYPAGDERLDLFFLGNGAMRTGKWNNQYGCINLIRLAEMYLIRAECNERLDPTEVSFVGDTPTNDYNVTHTRAGLTPVASVTLDDILLERRLELAFEGHKIHDMKRLHLDVGARPYDDQKLLFPIPQREMDANTGLLGQQNPGY